MLCDPWLVDGAFYGSWCHYPPLDFEPEDYDDVDYIYVSHIHPDHCHDETLERLDSDIPVLVHDFQMDFLRRNLEAHGFDVTELPHNRRTHVAGDLHLNILGADNCNPELCGKYFGCGWWSQDGGKEAATDGGATTQTSGSTQIDSMGVFDDGEHVLVNANDCRWPMSENAGYVVKDQYEDIDMLLMQYSAANFYPQCMGDYSEERKRRRAREVIEEMYEDAAGFVNLFEPDYYMPFAGSYTLGGPLADRNEYLAVARRVEAKEYFEESGIVEPEHSECVLLNSEEVFDLATGEQSAPYEPVDPEAKQQYIEEELADRSYPHHDDPMPTLEEFRELVPEAYEHFDEKREQIGWESDTDVLVPLNVSDDVLKVSMDGGGYEFVSREEADAVEGYVELDMDPRLLKRILRGPRYAHFNNAEIGSHITIRKEPDIYERPLYYSMSFFHV